jgi:hypothetical protein
MTRCKFKQGKFNCGSYAFNLYKEDIDQGDYCDHHYWQDQAIKARADEREACAKLCDELPAPDVYSDTDKSMWDVTCMDCAAAIRERGTHD